MRWPKAVRRCCSVPYQLAQELLAARRDLTLQLLLRRLNAAELLISTSSTTSNRAPKSPRTAANFQTEELVARRAPTDCANIHPATPRTGPYSTTVVAQTGSDQ
jgi:hypothetical protein